MVKIVNNYKHEKYDISLGDKCLYDGGKKYKIYGIYEDFVLLNGYDDSYVSASDDECNGYVLQKAVEKGYSKWTEIDCIYKKLKGSDI